jgi:hypothetical protein
MMGDGGFPGVVVELRPAPSTEEAFLRLAALPHVVFFDSARRDSHLARYSFLAADPFDFIETPADGSDALAELSRRPAAVSRRSGRHARLRSRPQFGARADASL